MRTLKVLCCAAAFAAATAPLAHAQTTQWSKKTYLTFSGPVQIPGKTLPAGTYTFQMADLLADRHVLQVLDKDEKNIIATIMTVPNRRVTSSDKNVVMFGERPAGSPPAVQMWYYPGVEIGNELVYPRAQAIEIAKASHTPVLSTSDAEGTTEEMKSATIARIDESGNEVDENAEVVARNDNPAAASASQATAQNAQPQTPASVGTSGQVPASRPARTELPRTAGNLVLLELLSALSAAGYFGARRARKHHEQA